MKLTKTNPKKFQPPLTTTPYYTHNSITKFTPKTLSFKLISISSFPPLSSIPIKPISFCTSSKDNYLENSSNFDTVSETNGDGNNGVVINIDKIAKRCRRIEASVVIDAGLEIVWRILTDYERLADFIPGLAVSRLVHKADKYARLFQIGQQNLPMGFKFNAKAVIDCYEKDLEILSSGQRRDIDFRMVEGDFDIFEGKWSIAEYDVEKCEDRQVAGLLEGRELGTILSYVVEVKPKPWLPVGLIKNRLCKDIKTNLCCVRDEAHLRLASSCS